MNSTSHQSECGPHSELVGQYAASLHRLRASLFDIYRDEKLEQKMFRHAAGWTRGYKLIIDGQMATGASVGDDELRFFFDLPGLVDATSSYCIGVAFGLGMFAFALARPEQKVFGIDNYSELSGDHTNRARALVERAIAERFPNVHLCVGTSPEDTPKCLLPLSPGEKLSIAFIDAMHTNDAASADFRGIRPYIDRKSVVLWHNANAVKEAFADTFDSSLFNRRFVLHTHGLIGIHYNSDCNPLLDQYLADNCMVWHDWEKHLADINGMNAISPLERRVVNVVRIFRRLLGRKVRTPRNSV